MRVAVAFLAALLLLLGSGMSASMPARAAALGLIHTHMAARAGAAQPARVRFASGTRTVYFDYRVAAPVTGEDAVVQVRKGGSSGRVLAHRKFFVGLAASLYVVLRAPAGRWPNGRYCTTLRFGGDTDTANGRMPIGWVVGRGAAPTCGRTRAHLTALRLDRTRIVLGIDRTGIYRLTGAMFRARGIDWSGTFGRTLTVQGSSGPVPFWISTPGPLNDRSVIEFYGRASTSRYGAHTVVRLQVHQSSADPAPDRVATRVARPGTGSPLPAIPGIFREGRRTIYAPNAPGNPWFYRALISAGSPVSIADSAALPALRSSGTARLQLSLWPISALAGTGPQHHLVAEVNGHRVANARFSGSTMRALNARFPARWLRRSDNSVRLTLPGDVRNRYHLDAIDVQTVSIRYPRLPTAPAGHLDIEATGNRVVRVENLPNGPLSVWAIGSRGTEARLSGVRIQVRGTRQVAAFRTSGTGLYAIAAGSGYLRPTSIGPEPNTATIDHPAAMEIVAPRVFLGALRPLAEYHDGHGIATRLVALEDVDLRYGWGERNPRALRTWLARVHPRFVLLVGADSVDYRGYLRCSDRRCPGNPADLSLMPSLYTRNPAFGEIPSDELLVARTDGGPSAAIGRVPALSLREVRHFVHRTLSYFHHIPGARRAALVSGSGDAGFGTTSAAIQGQLPDDYQATTIPADRIGTAPHAALLAALRGNPRIVNYVGHGNLEQWGTSPPVFSTRDVTHLPNTTRAQFFGWGCQTAYYVDPTDRPLNARLLFASRGGAVLTIGSTGLEQAPPQAALARNFFIELFHDPQVYTVGEALMTAERQLLARNAGAVGPVQSYELFGDPAIPVADLS